MRPSNRKNNQIRPSHIRINYTKYAEGSVLMELGDTKVLCTATVDPKVPGWLEGQGKGWITAEYGMLPRSTNPRMRREAKTGQSGRTSEIQRLIGRSLRTAVDLEKLGSRQIIIDCDVIQADGGTRTAAITGGFVALSLAVKKLLSDKELWRSPIVRSVASVSVGIYKGVPVLDLDYAEDSVADTDMNVVMDSDDKFIEIQGAAETKPYSAEEFQQMLDLAQSGIRRLIAVQAEALNNSFET